MSKIPLTIDKNYCAGWSVWHGLRELLQNAKDAEEHEGKAMEVTHYPKTCRLEINTLDTYVMPANLLVLGKTSKGAGNQRGKFGEGFVLGVLALVRNGLDVKFRNGDLSWTVGFEKPDPGHPLEGNALLTFKSRALAQREPDFKLEIEGITTEIWDLVRNKVLFLTPPKAEDKLETTDGTLLLHPDKKGEVYVRGLFVRKFDDLSCGYDLKMIELDRDRQMIDEWKLHYALGALWTAATKLSPELAAPRVYEMAKADVAEAKGLRWHADAKLLANVRERYEAEHGDAIPVTTNAEAREVQAVGGKPTMVSGALKELLEKGGLSVETSKKKLESVIDRRWLPTDLNTKEAAAVTWLETIFPSLSVVTFKGETPACHLIDEDTVIAVDRRLLDFGREEVLETVLAVEARRLGVLPLDVLIAHVLGERLESTRDPEEQIPH